MTTPDTTEAVERHIHCIDPYGMAHPASLNDRTKKLLRALAAERDALREQVKAERLANGHEKRLRLEAIALHQAAEAENAALRADNDMLRVAAQALRDAVQKMRVHPVGVLTEVHEACKAYDDARAELDAKP